MLRCYLKGLSAALRNWRFVLLVFVISLLGGCVFMGCSWIWLAGALDSSLATRTLMTSLDVNVFIDLATYRSDGMWMLLMVAVVLAVGGSLLWIWVNASVVAAFSGLHDSMAASCRAGAARYFQLLKLWIGAMAIYTLIAVGAFIVSRVLLRWTAGSAQEMTPYWIGAACALVALAAAGLVSTIHDHARIRCLGTSDTGGWAALWACAYVLRERRAVPLTVLLSLTTIAAWAVYQMVGTMLPANSELGLTASLLWAQVFMVTRAVVRVWAFAAASDLQATAEAL